MKNGGVEPFAIMKDDEKYKNSIKSRERTRQR